MGPYHEKYHQLDQVVEVLEIQIGAMEYQCYHLYDCKFESMQYDLKCLKLEKECLNSLKDSTFFLAMVGNITQALAYQFYLCPLH